MLKTATRVAFAASLAASCGTANAAWIGFDDLTVGEGDFHIWTPYVQPIDPQAYAAQGVILEGGWLWPGQPPFSQSMRPSDAARITFATGALPTHVSLHVTWLPEDILNIQASGPDGYSTTFHSWGYEFGPSAPANFGNQRISFTSASGISSLSFGNSVFMRFAPYVDNIYFGNVAAVPEPAPLLLAGAGLVALWVRRWATQKRP